MHFNICEFRENRCSENHCLLRGVNDIFSLFSVFLHPIRRKFVPEVCREYNVLSEYACMKVGLVSHKLIYVHTFHAYCRIWVNIDVRYF